MHTRTSWYVRGLNPPSYHSSCLGTGKTHTLVEIIRQLLFVTQNDGKKVESGKRVLVCGASNLSVDNILERLLKLAPEAHPPIRCMRIGHPARVKGSEFVLEATLDAQTARSDQVRHQMTLSSLYAEV